MKAKKISYLGLMLALSMIASYIDSLIPILPMLPGIKLGLANLIFIMMIYDGQYLSASLINLARILLTSFLFGNGMAAIYSIFGGILAFASMIFLTKTKQFGFVGISGVAGCLHNLGQLIAAYILLGTPSVIAYAPYLILVGTACGSVMGVVSGIILTRLKATKKQLF